MLHSPQRNDLVCRSRKNGIFHNAKVAVPIRTALTELNHPQPPSTIRTDNSTSHGILTSTIRQKCSKAFDMNIYRVKDRIKRKQFFLFWYKGTKKSQIISLNISLPNTIIRFDLLTYTDPQATSFDPSYHSCKGVLIPGITCLITQDTESL